MQWTPYPILAKSSKPGLLQNSLPPKYCTKTTPPRKTKQLSWRGFCLVILASFVQTAIAISFCNAPIFPSYLSYKLFANTGKRHLQDFHLIGYNGQLFVRRHIQFLVIIFILFRLFRPLHHSLYVHNRKYNRISFRLCS